MRNREEIILIDDESDILELLSHNLSKEGYITNCFSNPVEGLPYILNHKVDLILTDWLMPQMDGLEFCKKLKQNNETQDIPIIMLSCKNKDVDIQEALEFGIDDYLVKPFRINKLISVVKKLTK